MAGVVNPARVSPSSMVSPVRSAAEALTQRSESLGGVSKKGNLFLLVLEQWACGGGKDEVEGLGVNVRESSIVWFVQQRVLGKRRRFRVEVVVHCLSVWHR